MCNIQFVLLKSQHVSTILSGHHQTNTNIYKCSTELQNTLPPIWVHIYNDLCLVTVSAQIQSPYKKRGVERVELINPGMRSGESRTDQPWYGATRV
jgi:hypothetical protein